MEQAQIVMQEQQLPLPTEGDVEAVVPETEQESAVETEVPEETVQQLKARILELEEQLQAHHATLGRMTRECEEFQAYFPEVSLQTLPDRVWGQVRAGVPLAAAYALYERGIQNQRMAAEQQNARNAAMAPGVPGDVTPRYFSPSQVRAMSRREVRENYDRIFESMRHWQ